MAINTTAKSKSAEETLESIEAEIRAMVGMEPIKDALDELISLGKLKAIRRDKDIPVGDMSLHLVFKGPPGTGKTVLARKIGKLFKAAGLLAKGHCIEVDRSSLVGSYLGDAGKIVKEKFASASGGVLFIDEAYALAGVGDSPSRGDIYGGEAIQTLLKLMEDYRDDVIVIAAGYPEPMTSFLSKNEGLKSRFAKTFEFESYKHPELFDIFKGMLQDKERGYSYQMNEQALKEVERYIKTFDTKREGFGNGREVRNFFEKLLPAQASRFALEPGWKKLDDLSKEELLTITAEDVRKAARW